MANSSENTEQAKIVGNRVAKYRKEREMSMPELARQTGLSRSYLFAIEAGDAPRPSGDTLYVIARALGVLMSDLMGRELLQDQQQRMKTPPASLIEFAQERKLPQADVTMLAGIEFRGGQPQTKERWAHIYAAIRGTEWMDHEDA